MTFDDLKDVIAISCSLCSILQFLSGTLVCQKFVQKGSTGEASPFPFVSGCLSTILWLRYGFLIQERSIILVNTVGATLCLAYCVTFYLYSIKKSIVVRQFGLCLFILIVIIAYSSYNVDANQELIRQRIGTICCVMTVIFFAAPFTSLLHVCKVQSTESLPFPMIVTNFVVSLQWFIYGILIQDTFVQIPNVLGSVFSALQLSLFCIYPKKYKQLEQI